MQCGWTVLPKEGVEQGACLAGRKRLNGHGGAPPRGVAVEQLWSARREQEQRPVYALNERLEQAAKIGLRPVQVLNQERVRPLVDELLEQINPVPAAPV